MTRPTIVLLLLMPTFAPVFCVLTPAGWLALLSLIVAGGLLWAVNGIRRG